MMKVIKILFLTIWLGAILSFLVYVTYVIATKGWDGFMRPAMEEMAEQVKPTLPHD